MDRKTMSVEEFNKQMGCNFDNEKQGDCCRTCVRVLKCNCPVQGKIPIYTQHCNFYKSK